MLDKMLSTYEVDRLRMLQVKVMLIGCMLSEEILL
jgi:hypothetical protein